jgi:hypothetical protein
METLHIELDVKVEKAVITAFEKSVEGLTDLTQYLEHCVSQYLTNLQIESQADPWIEFLDNIDRYAVDTGIEDFSINYEHYLYGSPKRF